MNDLESLQKKAREEFDERWKDFETSYAYGYPEERELFKSLLDSTIREAYLAGARAYEEAVRLEEQPIGRFHICDTEWEATGICNVCGYNTALSALKEKSKAWWEAHGT